MLFRAIVRASTRCDDVPTASRGPGGIDVGIVEQPELELGAEDAAHRVVDRVLAHEADFESVEERPAVAIG